ncbi:MAG: cadmium-translocating P-type ATPase [Reyranella sp.]|nr:cadmium-translocating P-type ATPase [Reyranella sp.]
MDCASCSGKIETAVHRILGVSGVKVSFATSTLTVEADPALVSAGKIESTVSALGFQLTGVARGGLPDGSGADLHAAGASLGDVSWWEAGKARITAAAGMLVAAAYGLSLVMPDRASWVFIAATAIAAFPIARRAVAAAFAGSPFSIEMLMVIAAAGAVVIGAAEEAAVVVFLFLIGELLEGYAAGRARASIRALADIVPRTALVEEGDAVREIDMTMLVVGQRIRVRPGDRVAADGRIVVGSSSIDEAPITGESVPKPKSEGDAVFAGSINGDGVLSVIVEKTAADNTIARIIRLVEEAQEAKAPTERFIDRFSAWYTPAVVAVALLVAVVPPLVLGGLWVEWIYRALALLLIACPCALVISTPAAIAAGLSAGARRGLLLKGGSVLESAGKLQVVAFDKTGTLTEGKPTVTDVVGVAGDEKEVLALAAALEAGSSHPIAHAILARAEADSVAVPAAEGSRAIGGQGVEGKVSGRALFLGAPRFVSGRATVAPDLAGRIGELEEDGKTVAVLVADGQIFGVLAVRDEPRADARDGLTRLKALGIESLILTGDNRRTAAAVAERLGGVDYRAELMPEDKLRVIGELRRAGRSVAQVGDGINDAPALAAADIGIAMGSGADVALETADAAILNSNVADVARLIVLSRQTMAVIHQNIVVALGLKGVFMITTVIGLTGLWPAILADTGATVLVTLNALRLLRHGR